MAELRESGDGKVAILLCTRNSEKYLREQLDSCFTQTHANWELWVSDDGSTDASREVALSYADRGKPVTVVSGPCRGATVNFLHLAREADTDAEYFAWSDADDIWLPDKLERALKKLQALDPDRPALYCGRTLAVDEANREMYLSPLFSRPPAFKNALCQSLAGGNTMVFNRKTRELLRAGSLPSALFHDWWAYMLVTGCGGVVAYDPVACLRYRQHAGNLIGSNVGLRNRLYRIGRLFRGGTRDWNRKNIESLRERRELLTPENAAILDDFAAAAEAGRLGEGIRAFRRSGVHRQTFWQDLAMGVSVYLGKYP